jgi:hypothetical protein
MSLSYSINGVEIDRRNVNRITFSIRNSDGKHFRSFIDFSDDHLRQYEGVSNQHYVDGSDIIVIRSINRRIITIGNDGNVYRRATQSDYDEWMSRSFPNSFNATVYRLIKETFDTN